MPGINRLLGLRRLHAWLDPAINRQFKSDMQHYAQLFWHCPLSDADMIAPTFSGEYSFSDDIKAPGRLVIMEKMGWTLYTLELLRKIPGLELTA